MELTSSEDEDQDLIELEAVRRPNRAVKFDLTHSNQAQHYHEPKHTNALHRNSWSTSTQRVLSSMPSRSIRFNNSTALSRSTEARRRRPLSIVSTAHCATEDVFRGQGDKMISNVTQNEDLLNKLEGLSAGERVRVLREMPLTLLEKHQIRAWFVLWDAGLPLSANRALCCHQFKACLFKVLCVGCYSRVSQQKSIQLWQGVLKKICAHFGTGILSYFIFLRRLLYYNILLFLITGLFLVLPRISIIPNSPSSKNKHTAPDDFWMLTGMGILTDSVMFYGHYANSTNENCEEQMKLCEDYNIPLAYLFTIGAGMFITCVMLVYSMSKSFGKSFSIFQTTGNLALKVFCSWDFKVNKKQSVQRQSTNICIQLKEMLSELSCKKQKRNLMSTFGWLSLHLLVWSICLLCIAACMLAVYYLHPHIDRGSSNTDSFLKAVDLLKLPLVVSCVSHLLPGFFDMLSRAEHYDSPRTRIYVSIVRNLLLKGCIFSLLCYYWLKKISGQSTQCWETLVGQELYRLVLMDLLFAMLYIVLAEFLWGLCVRNITLRRRKLEFDIARDVLELIYGQTLVWFGVLFSPLLPAVQIGKLFLLFYFKKTSLMMNFQPPRKHWRATQMSSFFIKLLFFPSFTGALACVIYTMWRVKPSSDCGPFGSLDNMLHLGKKWFQGLGSSKPSLLWLSWSYNNLVDNPFFLFITAGLFLAIIYIHMQVVDGQKMIIARLQEQIDNEGEDKKFLIAKVQVLNEASTQQ